jgi:hypothetical protein
MSELAYDLNGDLINLPSSAQWWRVRRFRNPGMRGAPEVVLDKDGAPLVMPVDTGFVDFRELVDAVPGRYRLDPLDERRKPVANVAAAYVSLEGPRAAAPANTNDDRDAVIRELVRAQADMVKSMSERFAGVMQAAAELLRAADGAGLPARQPPVAVEQEDDEEEDEEPAPVVAPTTPAFDLNALVAQVVPLIVTGLMNGKLEIPKLAEMLDWRKASPKNEGANETAATRDPTRKTAPTLPPLDPAAMAHFIAIQSALTPEEAMVARGVAKELSPVELRGWFDELKALSVADAVARIRSLIHPTTETASGGVS